MTTYNRDWLRTQIKAYAHDRNLTDTTLDTFIDIAITKISHVMQTEFNEIGFNETVTSSVWELPGDVVSLISLGYATEPVAVFLDSVGEHSMQHYPATGMPQVYTVRGTKLKIRPFMEGVYGIRYHSRLALGADGGSTLEALSVFPFIFLDGALAECYDYKQDGELRERYSNKWLEEVQAANRASAKLAAGDAPAMRAI